jgi:hypothetical protein
MESWQYEKDRDSTLFNCEFDLNEMDESDGHLEKHDEPRI